MVLFPVVSFISYLAFWIPLGALLKTVLRFNPLEDDTDLLERVNGAQPAPPGRAP
jgi:hypothetical protein